MSAGRDTFKVLVWNMQHKRTAWDTLTELEPDIALLFEARVPDPQPEGWTAIGGVRTEGLDGYDRPWAAAVFSPHPVVRIEDATAYRNGKPIPIPFGPSRPGSWEATVVREAGRLEGCPCSLGDGCRHTRTRLDPRRPDVPYQMDYLFASEALAERLASCVVPDEEPWPPSDHYPIVATFSA